VTFQAIACDYDSTLARQGRVAPESLRALTRARAAGRKLILITGRTLNDLRTVFSELSAFDLLVVENGAVLFDPSSKVEQVLCAEAPPEFLAALSRSKVPFSLGRRVVATLRRYQSTIERLIEDCEVELVVTLNRESVMILPQGIDKGSGLKAALQPLALATSDVVGIGDAENDFAFLQLCGFSVAVANAIEQLKGEVDYVTRQEDGAGVAEIVEQVIAGGPLVETRD
jgi:phosphoglycolate phosphatase (TIGR01487 family)